MRVALLLVLITALASAQTVYRTGLWAVNIQDIDLDGGQFEGDVVVHVRDENDTELAKARQAVAREYFIAYSI